MSTRRLCSEIVNLYSGRFNSNFRGLSSACNKMTLTRKIINTSNAPRPIAPYNQGVVLDSTLYVSGCLGLDKDTMKLVEGDVSVETRQALRNLGQILFAAQSSYDKVIKTTIFMSDINDFAAINEVYKEFFTRDYPARSAVQVGNLPLNARVEVEVVAAVGTVKTICFFVKDHPARSAIQVGKLPLNARVEIEVVAAVGTLNTVEPKL